MRGPDRARRLAATVSLAFAAVAIGWIVLTDLLLGPVLGLRFEGWADAVKGILFMVVITGLLYNLLLRTNGREIALAERLAHQARLDSQLFQSGPESMWVYDPVTLDILEVNDTMVEASGWSRDSLLAMRITDLLPAEERAAFVELVRTLGPRGQPNEWSHVRPDGERRRVEVTSHEIVRDGRTVRLALGRDVTAQRQAEERLRASERRLQGVLSSMQEVAFSIDLVSRRILYLNEVAADVLGRSPGELLMPLDHFGDLVVPEDREAAELIFAEVVEKGWAEGEIRVVSPVSHEVRTLRVRVTAVIGPDGAVDQIDGVAIDLTRRHELEQLVAHQRTFDQLTGLLVRTAFHAAVDGALSGQNGDSPPAVVAMFDLDRFANVNESAGHDVGDAVLRSVAERMHTVMADGMIGARVGGDEFALFCPAGVSSATEMGSRLRAAVEGPFVSGDYEFFVSMSVGLAEAHEGATAVDLTRDAHLAMSAAKMRTSGIELFDPSQRTVALDRVRVEGDLRRALQEGRILAVYQPEVDLSTGRLVAVEALVRWDDPVRGLVPAAEFIVEAERSNLIVELGDVMLATALAQARSWHERFGEEAPVTWINLSRRELDDPAVVERVLGAIEAAGAPIHLVGIEVTETAFVAEGGGGVQALCRLAEHGIALALDDFGTGWSSLQSLKQFPLSMVKIDRSFVSQVAARVDDRQIVTAIVGMANGLSATTLAEGVESRDQVEALAALGCDLAQGYLFGRPEPPESISALIESGGVPEAMRRRSA